MSVDNQFEVLSTISRSLQKEYESNDHVRWKDSPFGWLKTRPSRQVGAIAERLLAEWLESSCGLSVSRSPDSEADRIVNGKRIEIKCSTLWKSGGYKFQQLRDQNYDYAICLGISPHSVHCWILPKTLIMERWKARDGIRSQHGGSKGADTAWLNVKPHDPYPWLEPFFYHHLISCKMI